MAELDSLGDLDALAVLALDGSDAVEFSPLLRRLHLRVIWFTSVADLMPFLAQGGVVVVGCRSHEARSCLAAVNELWVSARPIQLVVALGSADVEPGLLTMFPADADVLFLPSDAHLFVPTVTRALLRYIGYKVEAAALADSEWHPLLRASVRHILRKTVIGVRHTEGGRRRSLRAVAEGVGASQEYLSKVARAHSLPLRDLANRWLVVQGAVVRALEDEPWERIAWRAGFESASGLSDACKRTQGLRLREIDLCQPDELLEEFQDWLLALRQA